MARNRSSVTDAPQAPEVDEDQAVTDAPESETDQAETEAQAPEPVHTGYSGSGALSDLLKAPPRRVESAATIAAREQAAREAETADMARAFAQQIVTASPDGEWVRYDVADEQAAKRLRRIVNQGAEMVSRNFTVKIGEVAEELRPSGFDADSNEPTDFETIPAHWAVDVRTTRQTGAGRPPSRPQADSEAESEPEAETEADAPQEGAEAA
jgi:hypothetical protein